LEVRVLPGSPLKLKHLVENRSKRQKVAVAGPVHFCRLAQVVFLWGCCSRSFHFATIRKRPASKTADNGHNAKQAVAFRCALHKPVLSGGPIERKVILDHQLAGIGNPFGGELTLRGM
jgi:hypothetical protein